MVAGMLTHLSSLRGLKKGQSNKIHEMLAEAENERKHLMFIIEVVQPTKLERGLIVVAQWMFWHYYLVMYMFAPRTAHLMIHYFEEEAVKSYSSYLEEILQAVYKMCLPHRLLLITIICYQMLCYLT